MTRSKIWTRSTLASSAGSAALLAACTTEVEVPLAPDTSAPTETEKFVLANEPIADRYIVVLETPKDEDARARVDVASISNSLASTYNGAIDQQWSSAVHAFTVNNMSEADARRLAADPMVAYVEQDGIVRANVEQTIDQRGLFGLDRINQASL